MWNLGGVQEARPQYRGVSHSPPMWTLFFPFKGEES